MASVGICGSGALRGWPGNAVRLCGGAGLRLGKAIRAAGKPGGFTDETRRLAGEAIRLGGRVSRLAGNASRFTGRASRFADQAFRFADKTARSLARPVVSRITPVGLRAGPVCIWKCSPALHAMRAGFRLVTVGLFSVAPRVSAFRIRVVCELFPGGFSVTSRIIVSGLGWVPG